MVKFSRRLIFSFLLVTNLLITNYGLLWAGWEIKKPDLGIGVDYNEGMWSSIWIRGNTLRLGFLMGNVPGRRVYQTETTLPNAITWSSSYVDQWGSDSPADRFGEFIGICENLDGNAWIINYEQIGAIFPKVKSSKKNGTWQPVQTIEQSAVFGEPCGEWAAISVYGSTYPWVAYYKYGGAVNYLKCAQFNGVDWSTFTVNSGDSFSYIDIAMSSDNRLFISYIQSNQVRLSFGTPSSGWSYDQNFYANSVKHTSIALDTGNTPFIALYDTLTGKLACLKRTGPAIFEVKDIEYVNAAGITDDERCAIAISTSNVIHIAYYDDEEQALKYAKCTDWNSGVFSIYTVTPSPAGKYCSIALYGEIPYISFYDPNGTNGGDIKYAKWTSEDSNTVTISYTSGGEVKIQPPTGEMRIYISPYTFTADMTLTITALTTLPVSNQPDVKLINIGLEMVTYRSEQPQKDITITMNYHDIDIFGYDENKLVIGYYDTAGNVWRPISSTPNPFENKVVGYTRHLSKFALLQVFSPPSIKDAYCYPSPARLSQGDTIKFAKFTSFAEVKILSPAGHILKTLHADQNGNIPPWDGWTDESGKIASGVYVVHASDEKGNLKIFKIMIIK